jgi:hypothetical protein
MSRAKVCEINYPFSPWKEGQKLAKVFTLFLGRKAAGEHRANVTQGRLEAESGIG